MLVFSSLSPCPLWPITFLPFVIDSGATHHITTFNFISTLHPVTHPLSISVPTWNTINVTSTGDVKLSFSLTLHNVFSIPKFKFNLMSIFQLTKSLNCVVSFYPKFCFFQDLTTKTLIGMGEERNGLYYFNLSQPLFLQTLGSISFKVWHRYLGHLSINNVLNFISPPKTLDICDSCTHGKHTYLPFKLVLNKSSMPFEQLYCDIWVGYHTVSLYGVHYFFIIVDILGLFGFT